MENDTMTDRSDQIVTAFAGALASQQITLAVGDQIRLSRPGATWKTITSLSANFAALDGTAPVSRRSVEKMIAGGRVEWRAQSQQDRIAARVAELRVKRRPSAAEREELAILTYSGPVPRRVPFSDEVPF